MKLSFFSQLSLAGLFIIFCLLGVSFFLECFYGMTPCPLCLLQRFCMLGLGLIFFINSLIKLKKLPAIFLNTLGLLCCLIGGVFASRQAWLQIFPTPSSGNCAAGLEYIFRVLPVDQAIRQIWQGGVECSQIGGYFLSMSLAQWSLLAFIGLFILNAFLLGLKVKLEN